MAWFTCNNKVGGKGWIGRVSSAGVFGTPVVTALPGQEVASAINPTFPFVYSSTGTDIVFRTVVSTRMTMSFTLPTTVANSFGVAVDPSADAWFTEGTAANNLARLLAATGKITEFPRPTGSFPNYDLFGLDGKVYFTDFGNNSLGRFDPVHPTIVSSVSLRAFPRDLAPNRDGDVVVTSSGNMYFVRNYFDQ
jgi:streptogramin lyase